MAAKWYRLAALQGDVDAQFDLGDSYATGEGVALDHAEAVKWWHKAAEQGHAPAQYNLGLIYTNGRMAARDYVLAHMWYSLAATQGDDIAADERNELARNMIPAEIAEAQRLAREWKPK